MEKAGGTGGFLFKKSRDISIKKIEKNIIKENYKIFLLRGLRYNALYHFYIRVLCGFKVSNRVLGDNANYNLQVVANVIKIGKLQLTVNPLAVLWERGKYPEPDLRYYNQEEVFLNMNHIKKMEEYSEKDLPLLLGWDTTENLAKWFK